jgi:hypothetical protein
VNRNRVRAQGRRAVAQLSMIVATPAPRPVVGGDAAEARLATTSGLRVLSRDTAFTGVPNGLGGFGQANFDVSRDGSRLVVPSVQSAAYPLVVVPNWRTELRERLAANRN